MLKVPSWVPLVIFVGALGLAIHVAGPKGADAAVMDAAALQAQPDHAQVSFVATVMDQKEARDGRPLVIAEVEGGYQVTIYVADDACHPRIGIGEKYKFANLSELGSGFYTLNHPNAVTKMAVYEPSSAGHEGEKGPLVCVRVHDQVASWTDMGGISHVAAPNVPDGDEVTGYLVNVDGRQRFIAETQDNG